MPVVGGADDHRIQVLLFFQQFPEIVVSRAAFVAVGRRFAGVVGIHEIAGRLAAAGCTFLRFPPVTESGSHEVLDLSPNFTGSPLGVVLALSIDIADGDDLHVGLFQEIHHHSGALRPDTDAGSSNLIGGRNIPLPSQNMARHYRERSRRRDGTSNKPPP